MNSNMLKLNKDKTDFIVFSPKQHLNTNEHLSIKVRSSYINSSMYVRNLGINFDNNMAMEKQVNYKCKILLLSHKKYKTYYYINDETCKTSPSSYYFSTGLRQCILI